MSTNQLPIIKKSGNEHFYASDSKLPFSVHDYWSWAHSDLIDNTERGKLAEYIIASALGVTDTPSQTWDSYDLSYMGHGIEVKSAAYMQSWHQNNKSRISFKMQPTRAWDYSTNTHASKVKRQAEIYIFCLLAHEDKTTLNPLLLGQWEFYIVPTSLLDRVAPIQKSISLGFFKKHSIIPCSYGEIRSSIDAIILASKDIP